MSGSSGTGSSGGIGSNTLVTYNWNPSTQLQNFLAAEAAVRAGTPGARAKIVAVGDSTTAGVGGAPQAYRALYSYPAQLADDLAADGLATDYDNFLGGGDNGDSRTVLFGGAFWSGAQDAGGQVVQTNAAGEGVTFTPTAPESFDRVDINYIDVGGGSVTVSVGGTAYATLTLGTGKNTGATLTATVDIPAGTHSAVSITTNDANSNYIEGVALWSSTSPSLEVYDAGVGGATSAVATNNLTGFGEVDGVAALQPNLVLIDFGINDINGGVLTTAETVANIAEMVVSFRSIGADPIVVIPTPFESPNYATELPALRAALEVLSKQLNVPLIDLSATYDDDWAALNAAGLMTNGLHPDAALYADIGSQIATLLDSAVTGTPVTGGTVTPGPAVTQAYVPYQYIPTVSNGQSVSLGTVALNGDPLTAALVADGVPGGTLTLVGNSLIYTPGVITAGDVAGQGQDPVTFSVTDTTTGGVTTETEGVVLNDGPGPVVNLATAPVAFPDRAAQLGTASPGLSGDALTVHLVSDADFATGSSLALSAGALVYTPGAITPSLAGTDTLTYTVTDSVTDAFVTEIQTLTLSDVDSQTACYLRGTRIATPDGDIAIERLAIGDLVLTASGAAAPIRWIGRRAYGGRFVVGRQDILPIRIAADALDDGVPRRDLFVSPMHSMFLDGVLIPAAELVNGVTITQCNAMETVEYLHIELARHDVVFAEGAASESFVDDESRLMFHNATEHRELYPEELPVPAVFCAPRITDGYRLEATRDRLAVRTGLRGDTVADPLRGFLDRVDGDLIEGWAQSTLHPEAPVCVDVVVDGRVVARTLANRYRADLATAGIGSGHHSFSLRLDTWLTREQRAVAEVRRSSDQAPLPRSQALARAA